MFADISVIAAVGGDGTFYEILNGLANRPDAKKALRIPLAPIPTGTSFPLSWCITRRTEWTRPIPLSAWRGHLQGGGARQFRVAAVLEDILLDTTTTHWHGQSCWIQADSSGSACAICINLFGPENTFNVPLACLNAVKGKSQLKTSVAGC
jgi:hypothetical protein